MTRFAASALVFFMLNSSAPSVAAPLITDAMIEDESLPAPLDGAIGSARRGQEVFVDRDAGHCVLCHQIAGLDAPFQGDVGPALTGIGSVYSTAELRLRVAQIRRVYPDSIMPEYYRIEGLHQVSTEWQGKPALSAQQIEDIVAFLATLN